jgi:hypothetical protein
MSHSLIMNSIWQISMVFIRIIAKFEANSPRNNDEFSVFDLNNPGFNTAIPAEDFAAHFNSAALSFSSNAPPSALGDKEYYRAFRTA